MELTLSANAIGTKYLTSRTIPAICTDNVCLNFYHHSAKFTSTFHSAVLRIGQPILVWDSRYTEFKEYIVYEWVCKRWLEIRL